MWSGSWAQKNEQTAEAWQQKKTRQEFALWLLFSSCCDCQQTGPTAVAGDSADTSADPLCAESWKAICHYLRSQIQRRNCGPLMRYVNLLEEQVFHGKVRYSIVGEMTRGIEMVVEVDIYIKVPEKVIKDQKK